MIIQEEIEILKKFKQQSPWNGNYYNKKRKFKEFLIKLCELHEVEVPKFLIPKNQYKFKWAQQRFGDCNYRLKTIRIKNFSIITLLHEFRHWVDFQKSPELRSKKQEHVMEWRASYYSNRLFYTVWPERIKIFKKLIKNQGIIKNSAKLKRLRKAYKNNKSFTLDVRAGTCALIDTLLNEQKSIL